MNTVRGMVADDHNNPIAGAALLVGSDYLYTDSSGLFQLSQKHAFCHSLRILYDQFLIPGRFTTISAPALLRSAAGVGPVTRIVLHREKDPATVRTTAQVEPARPDDEEVTP